MDKGFDAHVEHPVAEHPHPEVNKPVDGLAEEKARKEAEAAQKAADEAAEAQRVKDKAAADAAAEAERQAELERIAATDSAKAEEARVAEELRQAELLKQQREPDGGSTEPKQEGTGEPSQPQS